MLEVKELYFDYSGRIVLDGLSFSVKKGEIVALIGKSGSGKTTLFKVISGLVSPKKGEVNIDGRLITFMRQEDLLLPWRTVMGNLTLLRELGRKKSPLLKEEAAKLLNRVGLEGYQEVYPEVLSGGMRQRVALARSLLQKRPLMLLDEPFASLDVILREQLYLLLREIRDEYEKMIVMVTHDFRDALALADRILVLAGGKIVSDYEVKLYPGEALTQRIRADLTTP